MDDEFAGTDQIDLQHLHPSMLGLDRAPSEDAGLDDVSDSERSVDSCFTEGGTAKDCYVPLRERGAPKSPGSPRPPVSSAVSSAVLSAGYVAAAASSALGAQLGKQAILGAQLGKQVNSLGS